MKHYSLSLSFSSATLNGKQPDFTGIAIVSIECLNNLKTLVWDAVPTQVKIISVSVQQGKFKVDSNFKNLY